MKPDKKNNKKNTLGLVSLILWALVLTMIFRSCSSSYATSNQVQVDYSIFRQWVTEGFVESVRMESAEYVITLKEGMEERALAYLPAPEEERPSNDLFGGWVPVQNNKETEYVTTPPPVSDLGIYELLDQYGVENYGSDPVDSSSYILSLLLGTLLPVLIMVGAMMFLFRGIGGKGGMGGIGGVGKSNAKVYVEKKTGKPCNDFRNGDHTTTLMRTSNGKVVEIQHNVMNPQPYNRLFKLTGTKGYATKYPSEAIALDKSQLQASGVKPEVDNLSSHGFLPKAEYDALVKKYYHPILTKYGELGRNMGHGGMDFMMDSRLVYCLQNGLPLDMDVYDLAEWCCLAELGTLSMDNNCAAVSFPDFTRGHWNDQKGYKHAYAPAEEEAAVEKAAKDYTAALKNACTSTKAWEAYDKALKSGRAAANAAVEKGNKAIAKAVAKASKSKK